MRKKIVAGNWKMNLLHQEGLRLLSQIVEEGNLFAGGPDVILFPPSLYVSEFSRLVAADPGLFIGAQNCFFESKGAYTGEISAEMIYSVGASFCMAGHSERRMLFNETDDDVAKKLKKILEADLQAVFCCGEPEQVRREEKQNEVVRNQLFAALKQFNEEQLKRIVIAYEPVWAIGTGMTASTEQAQDMHVFIRSLIREIFGEEAAGDVRILYGGSCNADNASSLFSCPDVDGGLIGGASLKPESFLSVIKAAR